MFSRARYDALFESVRAKTGVRMTVHIINQSTKDAGHVAGHSATYIAVNSAPSPELGVRRLYAESTVTAVFHADQYVGVRAFACFGGARAAT